MSLIKSLSFLSLFLVGVAAGCSEPTLSNAESTAEQAESLPVNSSCPITGSPVANDVTVKWNGKTIGFCCADCIPTWNELTDAEKQTKLDAAMKPGAASGDHSSHKHGQ